MAQRFNANRGSLEGEAVPLVQSLSTFRSFSVSDTGVLVYRSGDAGLRGRLTWYDRNGKEIGQAGPAVFSRYPSLSPDNKRIAVSRLEPQIDGSDIWLMEPERQVNSRFTFHPATENGPLWSPDGSRIVFTSSREGPGDLYVKPASGGGGSEEPLFKSRDYKIATDWSHDGRFILFQLSGTAEGGIWVLPLNGKPFPFLQTPFGEAEAQFSTEPGGPQWIAYASDEGGAYEIYVASFSGLPGAAANGVKIQLSDGGGRQPRWRRDGRELYYIAANGCMMAVPVNISDKKLVAGRPRVLFQTHITTEPFPAFHYAVTGDGSRFLIDTAVNAPSTNPMTAVLNWTAGLRR